MFIQQTLLHLFKCFIRYLYGKIKILTSTTVQYYTSRSDPLLNTCTNQVLVKMDSVGMQIHKNNSYLTKDRKTEIVQNCFARLTPPSNYK